jgi:hypothetical protein
MEYTIPPNGAQTWTIASGAGADSGIEVAFGRLEASGTGTAPSGVAIFGLRQDGVLVTEASVPASSKVRSGLVYVRVNHDTNTGIAIANPNGQDASVSFSFVSGNGSPVAHGDFVLGANRQVAAFVNEAPFSGPQSMEGSFIFTSSLPVGVIGLRGFTNERGEFLTTTVPVSPVDGGSGGSVAVIPHFAAGGGWTTDVVLTNTGNAPRSGTVQFFGQGTMSQAAPILNVLVNGVPGSVFPYAIPSLGFVRMTVADSSEGIRIGSARITANLDSDVPSAHALFVFEQNGITVSETSVTAEPSGTAFQIYAESEGRLGEIGSVQSGVAIANPSPAPVSVSLQLARLDGTPAAAPATVTIPSGGQVARFLSELFDVLPQSMLGTMRVTSSSPIAVIGVRGRYNERGDFLVTTTPPLNENAPLQRDLVFPHIVMGGGYSTQLVVYGNSATGGLWLNSNTGN